MLPGFRFLLAATFATIALAIGAFGVFATLRAAHDIAHDLANKPMAMVRSVEDRWDWGDLYQSTSVRNSPADIVAANSGRMDTSDMNIRAGNTGTQNANTGAGDTGNAGAKPPAGIAISPAPPISDEAAANTPQQQPAAALPSTVAPPQIAAPAVPAPSTITATGAPPVATESIPTQSAASEPSAPAPSDPPAASAAEVQQPSGSEQSVANVAAPPAPAPAAPPSVAINSAPANSTPVTGVAAPSTASTTTTPTDPVKDAGAASASDQAAVSDEPPAPWQPADTPEPDTSLSQQASPPAPDETASEASAVTEQDTKTSIPPSVENNVSKAEKVATLTDAAETAIAAQAVATEQATAALQRVPLPRARPNGRVLGAQRVRQHKARVVRTTQSRPALEVRQPRVQPQSPAAQNRSLFPGLFGTATSPGDLRASSERSIASPNP